MDASFKNAYISGMATDTRDRIVQSATQLFLARSYADVGVQMICDHAQVKKGSFYHYFKSKTDLALAVIEQQTQSFGENIVAVCFRGEEPPLQRFDCFWERIASMALASKKECGHVLGCPLGNLAAELSTQDEKIRCALEGAFGRLKSVFKSALDDAVAVGDLPKDVDTDLRADAVIVFLEGLFLMAKTRNDPDLIRRLGPELKKLLV